MTLSLAGADAAAIFLCGWVIKMMDDFLDLRYDVFQGEQSLAVRLGEGTLALFAAPVWLGGAHPPGCCVLTVSRRLRRRHGRGPGAAAAFGPLRLPGGTLRPCGSAFSFSRGMSMLWGAAVMLAVQAIDDLWDLAPDRMSGNPNLARRFGIVETRLLGLGALLVAAVLRPLETAMVFVSIPVVLWTISSLLQAGGPRTGGGRAEPIFLERDWAFGHGLLSSPFSSALPEGGGGENGKGLPKASPTPLWRCAA